MKNTNTFSILFLAFIFLFSASNAKAEAQIGLNTFYLSDQLTTSSTSNSTKTIWALDILFSPAGVKNLLFGWDILGVSVSDATTTTTTFTSSDMGPKFFWYFTKSHNWSLALSYHLISNAKYNPGTEETWSGTSLFVELGYLPDITENFSAGVKLNYYSASYNKQTISTTTADVAYKRNLIFPSMALIYHF